MIDSSEDSILNVGLDGLHVLTDAPRVAMLTVISLACLVR